MPFSNGSATALGVKAHVLYSQLLKADEYWALLGLKSTTEIAAFLKQTAGYKDKFETLVPANVHRIDLENALRSSVLAEAESFLFYLLGVWRDFFLDWLSWYEAEQLKSIFRWIHSKRLDRDEMRRRLYHIPSSKLPYEALLNCRDYREVLEALVNTQYYAVLREPVRRLINGEKSLFALEFAIDNLVETKLYSDINKLPAHEREILEPLFGERLDLLNRRLENIRTTVYRQTMFASFEREVHKRAAEGGDTTPDGLKQLWYELNRKYYGEAITIDEPLKMEWARIPHFYTPFYVYQYATGYSAATALASAILEQGEPATRRYLNFLTKGGSDYPIELLKGAGVDMSTPQPVQAVVRQFEETLDEMEELAK